MLNFFLRPFNIKVDQFDDFFSPARSNVLRYRREPFPLILYVFSGAFAASCIVTWFPMSFERGVFAYFACLGLAFWAAFDAGSEFSKIINEEMRRLRIEAEGK
jgi:hypothetical protein